MSEPTPERLREIAGHPYDGPIAKLTREELLACAYAWDREREVMARLVAAVERKYGPQPEVPEMREARELLAE